MRAALSISGVRHHRCQVSVARARRRVFRVRTRGTARARPTSLLGAGARACELRLAHGATLPDGSTRRAIVYLNTSAAGRVHGASCSSTTHRGSAISGATPATPSRAASGAPVRPAGHRGRLRLGLRRLWLRPRAGCRPGRGDQSRSKSRRNRGRRRDHFPREGPNGLRRGLLPVLPRRPERSDIQVGERHWSQLLVQQQQVTPPPFLRFVCEAAFVTLCFVQGANHCARPWHQPAVWLLRSGHLRVGLDVHDSSHRDVCSVLGWWGRIRSEDTGRSSRNSRAPARCDVAAGGWACVRWCAVREGNRRWGAATRLRY